MIRGAVPGRLAPGERVAKPTRRHGRPRGHHARRISMHFQTHPARPNKGKSLTLRLAGGVAATGMFVGMLAPSAFAADTAANGICNGVVNQTAHRGSVQE